MNSSKAHRVFKHAQGNKLQSCSVLLTLDMLFIMVRFRCGIRERFQLLLYKSLIYSHRSFFLRTFLRPEGHQTQYSVMENPPLSRHSNRSGCLFPVAKGLPVTWDFPQPRYRNRRRALGLCHWLRLPELLSLSEWQCLSASTDICRLIYLKGPHLLIHLL